MKEYSKEERESIFSKILDIDEIKDSLKPEGKRELYFIIDNKELENSRDQAIKDIKKAIEENEEMIEVNLRYLDEVKKRYENSDNEVRFILEKFSSDSSVLIASSHRLRFSFWLIHIEIASKYSLCKSGSGLRYEMPSFEIPLIPI